MYHCKKTNDSGFIMNLSKNVSPPGVKTRARLSSIDQNSGIKIVSPKTSRSRRSSMYVPSKAKKNAGDVFSKVWTTPLRPRLPNTEMLSENSRKQRNTANATKISASEMKQKTDTTWGAVGTMPKSAKNASSKKLPTSTASSESPKALGCISKLTSTPKLSLEQLTEESFYATPCETPISHKRYDYVNVFSATHVQSNKKTYKARRSVAMTPAYTSSLDSSPIAKRLRASAKSKIIKSACQIIKQSDSPAKSQLSSVLKSVERVEKQLVSGSLSSKQSKMDEYDLQNDIQSTPRVLEIIKRSSSPKILSNIECVVQSTNNNSIDEQQNPADITFLDGSIDTDSRSSRCIIL